VKIYPIPAVDLLNISLDNPTMIPDKLIIWDMQGRQVYTETNINNPKDYQINTSNLPSGMYILRLETSQGIIIKKVSIIR
jgi:extracellular elastinolytic metalloproteinase